MSRLIDKHMKTARKGMHMFRKHAGGAGRGLFAGGLAVALLLANAGRSMVDSATGMKDKVMYANQREDTGMRRSTILALLVALATVAGVLGALYFYVLRRERELDEYEQLLFSEDFNDDLADEDAEAEASAE